MKTYLLTYEYGPDRRLTVEDDVTYYVEYSEGSSMTVTFRKGNSYESGNVATFNNISSVVIQDDMIVQEEKSLDYGDPVVQHFEPKEPTVTWTRI